MSGSNDTVQHIKDRLSILEVVKPYVKLTRAGKYWRGLSPFSKEKTASFYVSPDRGSYYCFSTSQGGDHFTFIEKMEGVDFKGALTILAEKAGVEIQKLRPEERDQADVRDRLREATSKAEQFFAEALTEDSSAYTYARERGLTPETIRAWNLGIAPTGWRGLLEALSAQGYTPKELAYAGLIKEADEKPGTWYDRFRGRLMFPIRDTAGRTVAFTGRALAKDEQAKYLNSPETTLFKKGDVLFGMDRAKDAIRARGFAILVEGQFDLVLLHQAGFTNTIALSGTALSTQHLSLIKRYSDNLMLALDADRAGIAASARTAYPALRMGLNVKAIRLPNGKDPADILNEADGAKSITELIQNAQHIVDFFLSVLTAQEHDDQKLYQQIQKIVLPLIKGLQDPLKIAHNIERVHRATGLSVPALMQALRTVELPQEAEREVETQKKEASRPSTPISAFDARQRLVLAAISAYPDSGLAIKLKSEYCRITSAPEFPLEALADLDERLLFEAEQYLGEAPSDEAGDELIKAFEQLFLENARKNALGALRRAEVTGDQEAIQAALLHIKEIDSKRSALA
jgi:DNA primase